MLFNSFTFVWFYVCVFLLYWGIRERRAQNVLLLMASYIFYGTWSWKFLLLLIASSLIDYACGLLMAARTNPRSKRTILIASISANLTILAIFKYLGFFVQEAADFLAWLNVPVSMPVLKIVLPVGISFYTFQTMAYTIDVYRGKIPAERSLLNYSLYVAFFPQLVAGPIERAGHLLPQFHSERRWNSAAFESGLALAFWGLFKKVVIADNLAPYVDAVYVNPSGYSGSVILTATIFFAFQIYCDFSGYTDTARGVARMLGFELVKNFDHPYTSRSPVEFWRRWHISLSQWFQDYLYFPLAMRYMRKGGWASRYKPHIISMGLIGFWHGASWTFITFGLYWGFVIALYLFFVERMGAASPDSRVSQLYESNTRLLDSLALGVMFIVVCIGWVLFRAESMGDAGYVLTHLFSSAGESTLLRAEILHPAFLWLMIGGLLFAEWMQRSWPDVAAQFSGASLPGIVFRYALIVAILSSYALTREGAQPFIYFQF